MPVYSIQAQETAVGQLAVDELLRRKSLIDPDHEKIGWMLRSNSGSPRDFFYSIDSLPRQKRRIDYSFLPLYLTTQLDGKRPSSGGVYGMIPARGAQGYLSTGVQAHFSLLHIQLQPELVAAQNLPFPGFPDTYAKGTIADRFRFWNYGDMPERFGNGMYTKATWGQSSISFRYGAFELGTGTKNFWWGPGQWKFNVKQGLEIRSQITG